ncbi:MAG TPA: aminotransferase class I/II-fold pyridoxal phosphate-dependent enzyme [Pseudonocardiaceae bacterium]
MRAVAEGARARVGPLPAGGPAAAAGEVPPVADAMLPGGLPEYGVGAQRALSWLLRDLAEGAADPANPWCAGHLHCPPLAVAAAADLAASVLNPSMDSWDQAPSASALEAAVSATLARLAFPAEGHPDAVITSGGTESNLLGLLLAREAAGPARVLPVCGRNAHHSVARAAWLLGLPAPATVDCAGGRLDPPALDAALVGLSAPAVVVATAGSTDTGSIDPLPQLAEVVWRHGARLHVDAAYGGGALFSTALRPRLAGLELADTVSVDLHKFGWQPIAAGVLAVRDAALLAPLATTVDYLNAADDTEAGLPDLLGRSLRTSRRPDAVKIAVTFAALGRAGLAALVEHCCATAAEVAARIAVRRSLQLWAPPALSTVVFRPAGVPDAVVADVRRRLMADGRAVLGRATAPGDDGVPRRWLKLTLLHPTATADDYDGLLDLVEATAIDLASAGSARPAGLPRGPREGELRRPREGELRRPRERDGSPV